MAEPSIARVLWCMIFRGLRSHSRQPGNSPFSKASFLVWGYFVTYLTAEIEDRH